MGDTTVQLRVTEQATINPGQSVLAAAFFKADGTPFEPGDGSDSVFPTITTATAIDTAAKTTTSAQPKAGSLVVIKFTNGNSAASPTVAFNGGAARAVQLGGAAPGAGEITIAAGGVALFFFDGTVLHQIGVYS